MRKARLLSTVAATLLLTAGVASAQGMKEKSEGATPAPAAQQQAPAEKTAPASKAIENKKDKSKNAQTPSPPAATKSTETKPGVKPSDSKASDSKPDAKPTTAQTPPKPGATTGQGAAATSGSAKLTPEQRSKITTIIKQQKVAPAKLSISVNVGTRVPDSVRFYPLPAEVFVIYPEWRGYDYILVGDQILVVDPRTHEIVAILEA